MNQPSEAKLSELPAHRGESPDSEVLVMKRGNGPMRADDTALVSFFRACVLAGGTSIWPRTFSDAGDHTPSSSRQEKT